MIAWHLLQRFNRLSPVVRNQGNANKNESRVYMLVEYSILDGSNDVVNLSESMRAVFLRGNLERYRRN
jgi:hypothetical protein